MSNKKINVIHHWVYELTKKPLCTTVFSEVEYCESFSKNFIFNTFEELIETIESGKLPNEYKIIGKFNFGKKKKEKVIHIHYDIWGNYITITQKNFKPFFSCTKTKEVEYSMNYLFKNLSSNEFIEYLKDNNLLFPNIEALSK